jgi:DNA mismatch endonuclease (patch repair protein)
MLQKLAVVINSHHRIDANVDIEVNSIFWNGGHSVKPPLKASSPAIAASMKGNRSRNTLPEIQVKKAIRQLGLSGYRIDYKLLPGRPDIVFTRQKVAVFVHGCFWHRCPKCNLSIPRTNTEYWQWKFQRNIERDDVAVRKLERGGWQVLRIWGCEVSESPDKCAQSIKQAIENTYVQA